ncbi:MAG: hypothetical protein K8S55_03910 [Phycisphaerae bacterium]|nr:hypothetical protein [Phycisphaerae bacterium]
MNNTNEPLLHLPTPEQLHRALDIYLTHAYMGSPPPEPATELLPGEGDFDQAGWIMGEMVERDPADAPLEKLRSAAFRLGNTFYPNMKFRMSRPPKSPDFIFSVDCHDAVLQAPEGSADHKMLEELKAHNVKLADAIHAEWDQAGLPTEKNYFRYKILQAKRRKGSESGENSG